MISVLIPVYNFDIQKLVSTLHSQLFKARVEFEIIYWDDNSNAFYQNKNHGLTKLKNVAAFKSTNNQGSIKTRQYLAEQASYPWLLYLDADTMPVNKTFIREYLKHLKSDCTAYYGGIAYEDKRPADASMLRWKYGWSREYIPASKRNNNPYKYIVSGNFLFKRESFLNNSRLIRDKGYGLDNYFASILKEKNVEVKHIDNYVYHLGLEPNNTYLRKQEEAIVSLLNLYLKNKMSIHDNDLLSFFENLKATRLLGLTGKIYGLIGKKLRLHLTSKNPNIMVLQVYKILYMSYTYSKKLSRSK